MVTCYAFRLVRGLRGGDGSNMHLTRCFVFSVPDGSFSTSSLLWAVVSSRSANVLNQRAVLVEILYEGAASAGFAGLQLLLDAASSQTTGRMVESPVFFQSVSYALARLQSLGRDDCAAPMPFELELVHLGIDPAAVAAVASDELPSGWTMHKSATHGDRPYFYNASSKTTQWDRPVPDRSVSVPTSPVSPKPRYLEKWDGLSGVATNLLSADDIDISQRKALLTGLSQRVSCTVGPPGTGKTHTSARFVEILLSDALPPGVLPRAPILMLAVKNHALDQFLGRMLDRFPGRVARIGGVAASDALAAVNLVVLRDRHKALYKACKATDSPASASTFAPFKDAKLWREKGRAEYSFYRVQDALGGALHSCVTPSEWLSVAAFCTQASSEQLACLIASAPTRGRRRFPPVRGADVALLYRQELLLRLDSAKALAHRAADGFAGVGDSVFGSDSAAVRIAFGKSIVETLRKPFEYTLIGAPCSSERVSDSGSGEWQTAAPRTIRLPSLYDALIDALSVWTDGLDCASIRRMFEAPDVTADASLLRVRQGGPAVAGPLAKLAFPDVLDVSEAFDDDESDRLREQRLLFDESDDIDGAWDSQLHMKVRPQGQDAPFAAALARLRVVPLTLGTADASDPLARLAFVVQPWSPGLTHLDDPSSRDELVALAGHENLWDLEPRQRAIMLHVFGCNAREMYEDARATLTPLFTSANDAMIEADIACDVALLQDMAVIGMTINGAAKHSKLLDRLGVRVVVVEEAAEINEALFVAALPSTTEHGEAA